MSEGAVMSFQEHLTELRTRIIRITVTILLGFLVCWQFRSELFSFLSHPISEALADNGIYHLQAIHITESIIVYLKTSIVAAIAFTSPFLFYQLWAFVSPGLLQGERRLIIPVTLFTVIFFGIGFAFAYNVILPFITDWLVKLTLDGTGIEMMVTLQNAYATAIVFLLMFGFVFELPLVIFFLALTGAVTPRSLLSFFRYFVVLSFIIAAFFTPPDPISQLLMAVPLNILYGFGIMVAWLVDRSRRQKEATDDDSIHVGATSLRLMGGGIALSVIAGGVLLYFIGQIPNPSLLAYLPTDATWAVGVNATVVHREDPDLLSDLRGHSSEVTRGLGALTDAGVRLEHVHNTLLFGSESAPRGLMIRGNALGTSVAAIREALNDGEEVPTLVARILDPDSLAIGPPETIDGLQPGNGAGAADDPLQRRLLERLRTSGPIWLWLPPESPVKGAFAGTEAARTILGLGAVLEVGAEDRLAIHLVTGDRESCDALEARAQAARERTRGGAIRDQQQILADAIHQLAIELSHQASPTQHARLQKIRKSLKTLTPEASEAPNHGDLPALNWLERKATGWALRQDDNWLTMTTALENDGGATILGRALDH